MYKKNNMVYADCGKILTKENMTGFQLTGELEDFTETVLDLTSIERLNDMVEISGIKFGYDPQMDFGQLVEKWMKARYSTDEQVTIIQNKNVSEEGATEYSRMEQWRKWCEEVAHAILDDVDLSVAKNMVIRTISDYDKSDAVNQFYYQDVPMWLDKDTRAGLKLRFEAEEAAGEENTTLWYGVQSFTLPVASAKAMLNAIEMYASACYDKTQEHKANVMTKKKVETVLAYDYTVGYPPKLRFGE